MAMLAGPPEPVAHVEEAVASSPRGTVPVRIYRPQTRSRAPLLVWFHGGGFVVGDIDTYDSPMRALANRCGCTVVSVAYRLAPEHPYPAGIEDAYTALHWAAANARTLGADPEAIVAAMLARERCGPEVFMQVLLYPDGDARAGFNHASWRHYDGCVLERLVKDRQLAMYLPVSVDRTHPHVSPALSIPEYLRGMPSALIVTGEFDPQRDEGEQYAMRLRDAGIATSLTRNPGMIHGFFQMAEKFDAGKKVIGQVAAAIRAKSTGVGFSEF
jgi:acetyl esterase